MKIKLLLTILLPLPFLSFAQNQRTEIEGFVLVPKNQNPADISIYNKATQKGTITNYLGQFFMNVAVQDTLIISAVQYQSFKTVVTPTMLKDKKMVVEMKPYINELGEVVIYKKDFAKDWDLSYQALEYEYDFRQDRFSKVEGNAAEEALGMKTLSNGINFASLLMLAGKAIFKPKKHYIEPKKTYAEVVLLLSEKFDENYFIQNFSIPKESVQDFIFFLGEIGIEEHLLKPENELQLIDFIQQKAKQYIQQQSIVKKE